MLSPGTKLGGRYRLDERIAGGGMGDVWRGTDEVLGRTVAIKMLLPGLMEESGFAERFRAEARTMATINHPGVVDVYDYGSEQGTAFLIMEYVEGDALARTLTRVGRLTPTRTMSLIAQAADALEAAHAKGIVHRDVKPGNLLVRPNGTLVLTDFGISRSAQAAQLTAAGSVLGTAAYISPEQAAGQQATVLSDVYALGVVAYQCLAGRRPFDGDNPLEIAMRHVRDTPPPLPSDIPPAVCQIVERAMSKDPAARWPSAAALASVARTVASQLSGGGTASISASPQSPTSPSPQFGKAAPTSGLPMSPGGLGSPTGFAAPPGSPAGAPGGTRVFSGPMNPLGPHAVSGPPQPGGGTPHPGGFARGAAGVPPPPPAQETGYTYAVPSGAARPTQRRGGDDSRRMLIISAGVLAGLIILLACGIGAYALINNDDGAGGGGTSTASATASPETAKPSRA
ncbi:MAG: serine/threonine protein kinase, partial [Micromonosporaceae bacterium]|nr:serine/threonine protein kinase [Micromonosporaceae bacterium]